MELAIIGFLLWSWGIYQLGKKNGAEQAGNRVDKALRRKK